MAQLLTLLDGIATKKTAGSTTAVSNVFVFAQTQRPNAIDNALRRPGRLEREYALTVPTVPVRRSILEALLPSGVAPPSADLSRLAEATVGYVGADLQALCREAALIAVRQAARARKAQEDKVFFRQFFIIIMSKLLIESPIWRLFFTLFHCTHFAF